MRIHTLSLVLLLSHVDAWMTSTSSSPFPCRRTYPSSLRSSEDTTVIENSAQNSDLQGTKLDRSEEEEVSKLSKDVISKLKFRALHRELKARKLSLEGTTAQLRERLRVATLPDECVVDDSTRAFSEEDCEAALNEEMSLVMDFVDESDPDFQYNELLTAIRDKAAVGHWKAATRKLKQLTRRFGDEKDIPSDVFQDTLNACMANRLQGARASEPARKIMEQMVERGFTVDSTTANYCMQNCLGDYCRDSTHQGFGGIDTSLAMLACLEQQQADGTLQVSWETYDKIARALAKAGSVKHAVDMLEIMVMDRSETPPLSTFAEISRAAVSTPQNSTSEAKQILPLLAFAKAAGYELDEIAAFEAGRELLASAIVAAEKLDNTPFGLHIMTAAGRVQVPVSETKKRKNEAEETVGGDQLVVQSGKASQRAATVIHRRAIRQAASGGFWKLAVRILERMLERKLRPSPWVWRAVIACCAKNEKSRRSTGLLLDWVKLYEAQKADQPPMVVFNTVMNACEICGEHELTLVVLESMKKTHDTDGNIITFNIALKRLAKEHNFLACEGIIIGMLQAGIEPSVVSYTTAIAACAAGRGSKADKQPKVAFEWLKRMRSRNVNPNTVTYNTALATCLDGTLESSVLASQIAADMLADVDRQLLDTNSETDVYTNVLPDDTTKEMARKLINQFKSVWDQSDINEGLEENTILTSLSRLLDFDKSETADRYRELQASAERVRQMDNSNEDDYNDSAEIMKDEAELEYSTVSSTHRSAQV